jgi:hypothetical protein
MTGSGKTHSMDGISYGTKQVASGPTAAATDGNAAPDAAEYTQKMKTVRVLREPSALDSGLSLRCINELFLMLASRTSAASDYPTSSADPKNMRFAVKCSFIQIYQESVYDLLTDAAPQYVTVSDAMIEGATSRVKLHSLHVRL